MRIAVISVLSLVATTQSVAAHETWLEPLQFQIQPGATLEADIRNGQNFSGYRLSYLPRNLKSLEIAIGDRVAPVDGRMGDRPAVQQTVTSDGLAVIGYVSDLAKLTYRDFAKFEAFAAHKDFPDVIATHHARALPETDFSEGYTRYSKALVAVGSGAGADRRLGMDTEFVARDNPYLAGFGDVMHVDLFYGDAPRADAQIEVFDRAPDGTVQVTTLRTDAAGRGAIPVTKGHSYLLDAVVMRQPSADLAEQRDIVWETLWAALTFAVPDPTQ